MTKGATDNGTESEWQTRKKRIDPLLDAAGWPLRKAGSRGAFRTEEEETANGPADYALWLDGRIVGIVEAKKDGSAAAGDGAAELPPRLQAHAPARDAGEAARLAEAADDLRQLHVGSLPQGCPAGLHPAGVRRDGGGELAHIPGAHQAG